MSSLLLSATETVKPALLLRFQSMLLLFLPPGATILEVFPYKYWKEGYAPLANEWGVRHEYIMSRPVSWAKRLALFFVPLVRRKGGGEGTGKWTRCCVPLRKYGMGSVGVW